MSLVCVCVCAQSTKYTLLVQKTKEEDKEDKEDKEEKEEKTTKRKKKKKKKKKKEKKTKKKKKRKCVKKKRREKEDSSVHELVPINCAHKKKDVCVHTKNKNTYYLRHTMHTTALLLLFCRKGRLYETM